MGAGIILSRRTRKDVGCSCSHHIRKGITELCLSVTCIRKGILMLSSCWFFQMTGKDKDYRYMATSDLLNELNKEGFKADAELEAKLTITVVQQLEDPSGDVSGLAVKWFASY